MTSSWLFSWPVALTGFVSGLIAIILYGWSFALWGGERIREWRWARISASLPPNPFSSAMTTFDQEAFTRAYGLMPAPGDGASTPTS